MKKLILATAMTFCSLNAVADVAVIVNPANVNVLDADAIKKIYLGKAKSFSNGDKVEPVNQRSNSVSDEFNEKLVGKSGSQLNAYWSKLVFTGKGAPPKELDSDKAVVDFVLSNVGAVGYIDSAKVTDKVKVVGVF